ncbi:competence/damage-inducible protein CinA [Abyssogena phaseoliformis symbiont OG214]|uniref:CinA family protein n=1 Tax=Abyssogena phaseoliformis symbiont TaxID=596095 RepID=UPI00191638AA|nr:CinA family protein [Abyssogena phaseoliformis symbiont]MBW5289126.1 C-terminal domain of CinA type S [Candidatus Ruthia sp. Apha_13_S6]BBB22514.1 competence/damage-inducible protein CinA [Abyssogena phaseoliformis symbiont OG214]
MNTLITLLKQKSLTIAVAESCTGGSLSALLTSQSGSSAYFDRGFIAYTNQAKIDMLDVQLITLDKFGAVSEQVALEMAHGTIKNSSAHISIAITGIAGPTGGTKNKPVGMVCFGFCFHKKCTVTTQHFGDIGRSNVVEKSVEFVVNFLLKKL